MGKMKNGILDAFSGTIGRVVGTSWRGVAVMRSKAHSRKNANSNLFILDLQKVQQLIYLINIPNRQLKPF